MPPFIKILNESASQVDVQTVEAARARLARQAAETFVRAVTTSDVDLFLRAVISLNGLGGWHRAMLGVARLPSVTPEIQRAFLHVWIEMKSMSRLVDNRRTLANALRLLLPCDYQGEPMRLYRGTSNFERRRRTYGFSWTTDLEIARVKFAEPYRRLAPYGGHGIVLETFALPGAIMLVRQPENYFDEGEVIVDPFRLERVMVVERLRQAT